MTRTTASSIATIALIVGIASPGAAQIPPSVRPATTGTLTDEDRNVECKALKEILDALKKDGVWARQTHSASELSYIQKTLTSMNCPDIKGPLEGTWRIVGVPKYASILPIKGDVTLTSVSQAAGRKLAEESNWGLASSRSCRGLAGDTFFYSGTIKWDEGSFFDKSTVYWTDKPSTIVLCASAPDSTQAVGNFRDSHEAHGGGIQWNGMGEGQIFPESNEGPAQTFTPSGGK